jgi:hypothetical protein
MHAFDVSTGKLLWHFGPTGAGGLNGAFPAEFQEVPEGGAVWLFGLE